MVSPQLLSYIKEQQSSGSSQETITASLKTQGWSDGDIAQAFASGSVPTPPAPVPTPSSGVRKPNPIALILIIVLLIALAVGGWFGYKSFVASDSVSETQATPTLKTMPISSLLDPNSYTNSSQGFSIHPPKGWEAQEGYVGSLVTFLNPVADGIEATPFTANVNVVSESAGGLGLDEYVANAKKSLPTALTGYRETESKKVTINGEPGYFIGGTFTYSGILLRNRQLAMISDGAALIVTATSLSSDWSKYDSLFDTSLRTFKP